ncbi:DUF397 domain-containing protein [Streptomyces nitrosporeus]|uniref:DUF397 domain-containing protein n=1 Tax=Streptomyces nitrosporeus TaxID=28894 RepID=A0A5J6FDK5_9ACTN|nr:DUF397 domain-containing protein [Streptomyces nitrosporeus]QEU74141.1 DUF397 domain-containing protein [Streptomyces nitrosporeus]
MMRETSAGDAYALEWFRSSYSSSGDGNDCVEVATTPGTVHVRDSKSVPGPHVGFGPTAWADFVEYAAGS